MIVPAYNRARLTLRAIRSALDQTYADLEVIVVDDGSTDGTREAVAGVGDERVRYVWQENSGLPAARNRGMAEARGEFFAFLDSDDAWLPAKIEAQLSALLAFPGSGMVWTDFSTVDDAGNLLDERHLTTMYTAYVYVDRERDFAEKRLLGRIWPGCPAHLAEASCYAGDMYAGMFMGNLAHDSTVLITRERQQAIGEFDVAFDPGYEFFLRACGRGDVVFVDAPLALYRMGADDQMSAPGRLAPSARASLAAVHKALAGDDAAGLIPKRMVRERLAVNYGWLGREEFFEDRRAARRHLWVAAFASGPLIDRSAQAHACVLWILSFFPSGALRGVRRARRWLDAAARLAARRGTGAPAGDKS